MTLVVEKTVVVTVEGAGVGVAAGSVVSRGAMYEKPAIAPGI